MFNDASATGMIEIVNDNGEANHKVPCRSVLEHQSTQSKTVNRCWMLIISEWGKAEEHSVLSSIKDIGITYFYKLFQINVEEAKEVDTKQWDPDSDEEDKDDLDESGESEEEEYSD